MTLNLPSSKTGRASRSRALPIEFPGAIRHESEPNSEDARRILTAALAILEQGILLLGALTADQYTTRVPVAFNAAIGGHYRHCLDHFVSLLRSIGSNIVDYDDRERDRRIETDPVFALSVTHSLHAQLADLSPSTLNSAVGARCEVSYSHGNSPVTGSSFGRELVYAIAHAIHHFALISVMARLLDIKLPEHFGIAPSTVAHQAKQLTAIAA